jgi:tight adherence protein C
MLFAVSAFVVIFLVTLIAGLALFYRESMAQRVSEVITPNQKKESLWTQAQATGAKLTGVLGRVEKVMPRSEGESSVIQQRLIRAGFRKDKAVNYFYSAKVLVPLFLTFLALVTGLGSYSPFFIYAMCLALGFLAPDFWLGRRITARQAKIRRGLPDVLDLLVICIEAGLGMDQATARTSEELRFAQPVIADELGIVVLEQRAGRPRAEAWRHLAERTAVDSVQNVVAVLIQSEKFGTSVAKNLRIHAEVLRTKRKQHVEEQAAKTTVKLVFPLVLFIFPSIFLVTLGPAVIMMMESFQKYLAH